MPAPEFRLPSVRLCEPTGPALSTLQAEIMISASGDVLTSVEGDRP